MHVSRSVFDVGVTVRKLSSRFRRPPQVSRPEWPVISACRPLFYLIRFFGLAPFEITDGHVMPGSYAMTYSLFCILIHTYVSYVVISKFVNIRRESPILDITETAKNLTVLYTMCCHFMKCYPRIIRFYDHVVFNNCVVLLNGLVAVWTRNEFIGVLKIVKNFDSRVRDLGHPRKEGAAKVWSWGSGICSAFIWITVSRSGMVAFAEPWVDNMTYLLNYLATSMSIIKFSSIVLLLGQRFRHLNQVAQYSKESTTNAKKYITIDFKVIQQLHNSLMNASESLSSQYSWSLLMWLINLCVHSVSNLYFLIDWTVSSGGVETQWFLINCISWWLIAFVAQLLLLHIACHFTSEEANSIGWIVIDWKSLTVNRNYRVESSLHLINRRLNFSAAGCFHVNLPLLRSITALLTTYLVLLLQFQNISSSLDEVDETNTNS